MASMGARAMAFGIASGVKPEQGLITAIIGGLLVSLLGGSKVQIGGPAGAFVAMLYGISLQYGLANMLLATMMAGVLLFVMGALRMGQIIRFVPISIVIGFTNGIAVVIMLSQLKDFLLPNTISIILVALVVICGAFFAFYKFSADPRRKAKIAREEKRLGKALTDEEMKEIQPRSAVGEFFASLLYLKNRYVLYSL